MIKMLVSIKKGKYRMLTKCGTYLYSHDVVVADFVVFIFQKKEEKRFTLGRFFLQSNVFTQQTFFK